MKLKTLMTTSMLVVALSAGVAQAAPVIVNGSFETGDLTGWGGTMTTDGFGLNPFGTAYGVGMDGTWWAWVAGYEIGRDLTQTISGLTAGAQYAIDFIMASEFVNSDQVTVSIDGGASQTFTAPPYNGGFWDSWVAQQFLFTASGTSETLRFSSFGLNAAGYDVGIDNVRISAVAVPEPASLALFALGLAGAVRQYRRRARQ